jgi:hypothetical protein
MDELQEKPSLGLVWLANNIVRVERMCKSVNCDLSDDLWSMCVDTVDEIFNRFDVTRNVPLDRFMLNILRKRAIAWCVRSRKINGKAQSLSSPSAYLIASQSNVVCDYEDREYLLILIGRLTPPLTVMQTKLLWSYIVEGMTFTEIANEIVRDAHGNRISESSVRREYWQVFWRLRKLA